MKLKNLIMLLNVFLISTSFAKDNNLDTSKKVTLHKGSCVSANMKETKLGHYQLRNMKEVKCPGSKDK